MPITMMNANPTSSPIFVSRVMTTSLAGIPPLPRDRIAPSVAFPPDPGRRCPVIRAGLHLFTVSPALRLWPGVSAALGPAQLGRARPWVACHLGFARTQRLVREDLQQPALLVRPE